LIAALAILATGHAEPRAKSCRRISLLRLENVANEYSTRLELFERLERILMHGVHHV
jgi:hypothetical protein